MSDETKPETPPLPSPPQPGYATKICPHLSAASIAQGSQPQRVIAPGQPQPTGEAVACQGPNCMWYMLEKDQNGRTIGGNCAVPLTAYAQHMTSMLLGDVLQRLAARPPMKHK